MNFVAYGNTYPVKEELKSLGGRWNKETRHWEFTEQPNSQPEGVVIVSYPLPEGWFIYDSEYHEAGSLFRRSLSLRDKETREYPRDAYRVSVATWEEQGFDDFEERWTEMPFTLARPLTNAEWEAKEAKRLMASQIKETRQRFLDLIHEKGNVIEGQLESLPEGDRLVWTRRSQPDYVIRTADSIVVAHYNGASGDDWSYNNYRGYVVWSCPLAEAEAAYNELLSTFETEVN